MSTQHIQYLYWQIKMMYFMPFLFSFLAEHFLFLFLTFCQKQKSKTAHGRVLLYIFHINATQNKSQKDLFSSDLSTMQIATIYMHTHT